MSGAEPTRADTVTARDGCSHAPGEPCDRRGKCRLVCNRCEKSKLNYHRKLQGLPAAQEGHEEEEHDEE